MMRDAAGNDVRIETPVAIAVERPIVDDHGVVHSRDGIGPRCVGEEQAQVARIPPQVVGHELITASPIGEYPRPPGSADLVAREQGLRDAARHSAERRRANPVHHGAADLIALDLAVRQPRLTDPVPPGPADDVVGNHDTVRIEGPNRPEADTNRRRERHDRVPLDAGAVDANREDDVRIGAVRLQVNPVKASVA